MSEYMGFDLRYSPEALKAHLGQVTALLHRRDNYRVVLTDRIPEGAMLYAGMVARGVVRAGEPYASLIEEQEALAQSSVIEFNG